MFKIIKKVQNNKHIHYVDGVRNYRLCSPPRPPGPCGCEPQKPSHEKIMPPSSTCRKLDIPPNPCVPRFHHGKDTWKKYKYIALFVGFPLILIQAIHVMAHETPPKGECRDYEYMRRRTKRFPWGDGTKTFFHNDHVNHLPGECEPPPLDCD